MMDLDTILLVQYLIIPIIFFKYGENKDITKAFLSLLLLILFLRLTKDADFAFIYQRFTYDYMRAHFILATISLLIFIFAIIKDKYYQFLIVLATVYVGIYFTLNTVFDEVLPPRPSVFGS